MRNINPKTEKLRREKISKTMKEKHRTGEIKCWNKGIKMSEDYCKKLSDYWKTHGHKGRFQKAMIPWNKGLKGYMAGENNNRWKGGITPENNRIRNSMEMRNWRKKVFERDNFICQVCYNIGGNLHPHHLYSFSKYPELRLDVNNGMTLCGVCHEVYTEYRKT